MSGMNDIITILNSRDFVNNETEKYSVWVYDCDNIIKVYDEEMPNTVEVWFKFYKFNHYNWKMLEIECIEDKKGNYFYNRNKINIFMLRRMICSTNIPDVLIEYDKCGNLTDESFKSVTCIHPRILRAVMNKIRIFPNEMKKSEEREFERQCSVLFGKGDGVTNPHPYIVAYCNLVSFWDKFGMNYFDILRLPQDMFVALKKVMSLENTNKSTKLNEASSGHRPYPSPKRNRVKF